MPLVKPSKELFSKLGRESQKQVDEQWIVNNLVPKHEAACARVVDLVLRLREDPDSQLVDERTQMFQSRWIEDPETADDGTKSSFALKFHGSGNTSSSLVIKVESPHPTIEGETLSAEQLVATFGPFVTLSHDSAKIRHAPGVGNGKDSDAFEATQEPINLRTQTYQDIAETLDFIESQLPPASEVAA